MQGGIDVRTRQAEITLGNLYRRERKYSQH
jgi:hypothetical protein